MTYAEYLDAVARFAYAQMAQPKMYLLCGEELGAIDGPCQIEQVGPDLFWVIL
jgi:hypothetical protein